MGYIGVSVPLGTMLLVAPEEPEVFASPPTTYVYEPSPRSVLPPPPRASPDGSAPPATASSPIPSRVAMPVPAGFRRVAGPGGLVTTVPEGWTITRSTGPGAMQATDPADPTRFVRYGGSRQQGSDLLASHVDYERRFARDKPDFRRVGMAAVDHRGAPAVEWEFEHGSPEGVRRARSLYWRVNGVEHFVYAASLVEHWPQTEGIYRTMVDNSSP